MNGTEQLTKDVLDTVKGPADARPDAPLLRRLTDIGFENAGTALAAARSLLHDVDGDEAAFATIFSLAAGAPGPDLALFGLRDVLIRAGRDALLALAPRVLRGLAAVTAVSASLHSFALTRGRDLPSLLDESLMSADGVLAAVTALEPGDFTIEELVRQHRVALLRLAVLDLGGELPLEEVFTLLSGLAEKAVAAALELAVAATGIHAGGLTVLAMGKLGARELNYSSDIDLIFLADESRLARADAGTLAETLVGLLEEETPFGRLYRVDLRLRPEGRVGELVPTVRQAVEYYRSRASLWEYQAMLRARPLAGSRETAASFLGAVDEVVYPRHVSGDELARLVRMRRRRSIGGLEVKEAPGGLRDIEFAVQWYQLLYGHRKPEVRRHSTLDGLTALRDAALLSADEADALRSAYCFLRSLEHRLQLAHELQTFRLPADPATRRVLARALGMADERELLGEFERHRQAVGRTISAMLERVGLSVPETEAEPPVVSTFAPIPSGGPFRSRLDSLGRRIGREAADAVREVMALPFPPARVVERAEALAGCLDDSEAPSPQAFHALVLLAAYSDFFQQVVLEPRVASWLIDHLAADAAPSPDDLVPDVDASELALWLDRRLAAAAAMELRATLPGRALQRLVSGVIEAVVRRTLDVSGVGREAAVFALGRLAVRECGYRSDADLLFVAPSGAVGDGVVRDVQELLRLLNRGVGVATDERLRPEGGKGVLVPSRDGFLSYLRSDARPWEYVALWARMRPLNEAARDLWPDLRRTLAESAPSRSSIFSEVAEMRRLQVAQAGPADIKRGPGGVGEVEMLVHALMLANRTEAEDTRSALTALRADGVLPLERMAALEEAHAFLGDTERLLRMRRVEDSAVLPPVEERRSTAALLGYSDGTLKSAVGLFSEDLQFHRKRVGEVMDEALNENT